MTDKPENPPAFPNSVQPDFQIAEPGMSLRDWFAGRAMQALVTGLSSRPDFKEMLLAPVGRDAYRIAAAMLTERTKPNE